jgi:hypothetical protein
MAAAPMAGAAIHTHLILGWPGLWAQAALPWTGNSALSAANSCPARTATSHPQADCEPGPGQDPADLPGQTPVPAGHAQPTAALDGTAPRVCGGVRHAFAGVHCAPPADCPGGRHPPTCKTSRPPRRLGRGGAPGPAVILAPAPTHGAPPAAAQWLQFWLQFTKVQDVPYGFTCPGQDAPEPPRTAGPRTFNPWVLGSSPRRPTALTCGLSSEQGPAPQQSWNDDSFHDRPFLGDRDGTCGRRRLHRVTAGTRVMGTGLMGIRWSRPGAVSPVNICVANAAR